MKLKLGISDSDREKIKSCSVIFHAAASVRFDDPLKSAILLNTRGTRELCELAKAMPNLKALVHVSTAYVQPKNLCVEERIFESDDDWKTFIKYAEVLDDDLINCTTLKFVPTAFCLSRKKTLNVNDSQINKLRSQHLHVHQASVRACLQWLPQRVQSADCDSSTIDCYLWVNLTSDGKFFGFYIKIIIFQRVNRSR